MENSKTKTTALSTGIDPTLEKRLQKRLQRRNEDLILDLLEQREVHKNAIKQINRKIKSLTETPYFKEEEEVSDDENL